MDINDLIKVINDYNPSEVDLVMRAYKMAEKAHEGQFRESGEPYIIHPLHVCMNLAEMHADGASLCAGMLHDVVEDTDCTLEMIKNEFGDEVATLVDGVTKINNLHFPSKDDATNANIRKLINSLSTDVRIIIVKLCDRLHNIRTLEFKKAEKRVRTAEETLRIFCPLAYYIGLFRLKCELEDICFYYIDKDSYLTLQNQEQEIMLDYKRCLDKTIEEVDKIMKEHNIEYTYRIKIQNLYQIYTRINKGYKISDIHDLISYKLMVNSEEDCYKTLGLIHKLYTPMNYKFKDYIALPKTNMYRSLHTTVFAPENHILQFQIKTPEMDDINTYGLTAYWRNYEEEGKNKMQTELKNHYQFFNTLIQINSIIEDDKDFVERVKQEIFTKNIYVYSLSGDIIELPYGSTVIDFAYKLHTEIGDHLYKAFINGKQVPLTTTLNNKDRILILQKETAHPTKRWLNHVETLNAKRRIRNYLQNKGQ